MKSRIVASLLIVLAIVLVFGCCVGCNKSGDDYEMYIRVRLRVGISEIRAWVFADNVVPTFTVDYCETGYVLKPDYWYSTDPKFNDSKRFTPWRDITPSYAFTIYPLNEDGTCVYDDKGQRVTLRNMVEVGSYLCEYELTRTDRSPQPPHAFFKCIVEVV